APEQAEADHEPLARLEIERIGVDATLEPREQFRRTLAPDQLHSRLDEPAGLAMAREKRRIDADQMAGAACEDAGSGDDLVPDSDVGIGDPGVIDIRMLGKAP